jgi:hypothetical protein
MCILFTLSHKKECKNAAQYSHQNAHTFFVAFMSQAAQGLFLCKVPTYRWTSLAENINVDNRFSSQKVITFKVKLD